MALIIENVADTLEIRSASGTFTKEKLINQFAKITQFMTWPIAFIIFNLLYKIKINNNEIFKKIKGPFIIIANHTTFFDSFLFRLILGFRTPHLPLRFMAVKEFESTLLNFFHLLGIINLIHSIFGVLVVTPGLGIEKNTKRAREIIGIGGNLVIYPEGRITNNGGIGKFKKGAAYIYKNTLAKVVPISFRPIRRPWKRTTIFINIGNTVDISKGRSEEEITKTFHATIEELYKSY